jgi:hypothetical protein
LNWWRCAGRCADRRPRGAAPQRAAAGGVIGGGHAEAGHRGLASTGYPGPHRERARHQQRQPIGTLLQRQLIALDEHRLFTTTWLTCLHFPSWKIPSGAANKALCWRRRSTSRSMANGSASDAFFPRAKVGSSQCAAARASSPDSRSRTARRPGRGGSQPRLGQAASAAMSQIPRAPGAHASGTYRCPVEEQTRPRRRPGRCAFGAQRRSLLGDRRAKVARLGACAEGSTIRLSMLRYRARERAAA